MCLRAANSIRWNLPIFFLLRLRIIRFFPPFFVAFSRNPNVQSRYRNWFFIILFFVSRFIRVSIYSAIKRRRKKFFITIRRRERYVSTIASTTSKFSPLINCQLESTEIVFFLAQAFGIATPSSALPRKTFIPINWHEKFFIFHSTLAKEEHRSRLHLIASSLNW